jgi:hypothetical protein
MQATSPDATPTCNVNAPPVFEVSNHNNNNNNNNNNDDEII